jgi:hypothetical protein
MSVCVWGEGNALGGLVEVRVCLVQGGAVLAQPVADARLLLLLLAQGAGHLAETEE